MWPAGQPGTDLAVLGGDPRSTVGGASAATVLDDASDGTEMISASTAMGLTNPKTKTSTPIAEELRWVARFLVIGMVRARCGVLEARCRKYNASLGSQQL